MDVLRCRNFLTDFYFALCWAFVVSVDRFIENYAIVEIWGISRGLSGILRYKYEMSLLLVILYYLVDRSVDVFITVVIVLVTYGPR